jgi:hypothetical protein
MRPLFARVVHRFFVLRQGSLEASYTFAQALTQFGDLLGAEHQNRNAQDDQQVHRLKQTFEHVAPHFCHGLKFLSL